LRWAIFNNNFSIIFGALLRYENVTQYDLEEDFFCFGANSANEMVAFEGNHKSAFVEDMAMIYVVQCSYCNATSKSCNLNSFVICHDF